MNAFSALIVASGLAIVVSGSNLCTKQATPAPNAAVVVVPARADTTSVLDEVVKSGAVRDDDWAEPRVDLNGNEIDDAVGDYRVDPHGEMYERHAPDTALTRLTAPRM
jgi:hypothetical protein